MRGALALFAAMACVVLVAPAAATAQDDVYAPNGKRQIRALVYHETTGFRHASIQYAIRQLQLWGQANRVRMTATRTSAQFTDRGLGRYDVVVWLSTVGGVRGDAALLTDAEWAAFQRYMENGGSYAGIHAASDCCDESPWYGELLGLQARFANHPGGVGGSPGCIGSRPRETNLLGQTGSCFQAVVQTEDERHPSTRHLPDRWNVSDELYNFQANPRSTVHVLQTLDERSYNFQPHPFIRNWGTLMGADHPITWCQFYSGGRVWYTGLGHDANIYAEHDSMRMIIRGIQWAGGRWGPRGCGDEG
jgi:type 1 glutamine amidotransferase